LIPCLQAALFGHAPSLIVHAEVASSKGQLSFCGCIDGSFEENNRLYKSFTCDVVKTNLPFDAMVGIKVTTLIMVP